MIKFSYHKDCIGKPEKRVVDGRLTYWIGDKRINLGYNWVTASASFEDIFDLISQYGYSFAPALTSNHRIMSNFLSHELALVDIDSGMTIAELKEFPFYKLYGSGYYTTPSHTESAPRFRILYRLPIVITDIEIMREIYEGLLAVHGAADISCKDPVRLFYGTVNAEHREITDRMIDSEGLNILYQARDIVLEHNGKKVSSKQPTDVDYAPKTIAQVGALLDELRRYYGDFNYSTRRDVTWAVASAVGGPAAVDLMRARWSDHDKNGKYEMLVADHKTNSLTLGTIYHMIRQHNPSYGRRVESMSIDELRRALNKEKGNK